ncbi:MAG: histidine kinase [Puniceicoccaceae bacterium]
MSLTDQIIRKLSLTIHCFPTYCLLVLSLVLVGLNPLSAQDREDDALSYRIARGLRPSIRENERALEQLNARRELLPLLAPGRHGDSLGFHSRFQKKVDDRLDILIDLGSERSIDRITLFPVSTVFQGETIAGYGFPKDFKLEASNDPEFEEAILIYQSKAPDNDSRPEYPVQVFKGDLTARYLRLQVLEHWSRADGRILTALGEVMVLSKGRLVSIEGTVVAKSFNSLPDWSSANLIDGQTDLGLPIEPVPSSSNGFMTQATQSPDTTKWVQLELPKTALIEEVSLYPTQPLDAPSQYSHGFPRRFRVLAAMNPDMADARVIADYTEKAFPNPGDNPVFIPGDGQPARYIRLEAEELWHISNDTYALALSEIQVMEQGQNVAVNSAVTAIDIGSTQPPFNEVWDPSYLLDGFSSQNRLISLEQWLDGLEERKLLDKQIQQLEEDNRHAAESTILGILVFGSGTVGILLWLIMYNKVRRRREIISKQRELRTRISRDLHDDLGSRLGGMRLISESLLKDPELPELMREDIDMIYRSSGEANEAMRDIVWLLDSREASRSNLVQHMRQLVPSVLGKVEYQIEVDDIPDQDLDFDFRRHVLFSFKECLGNVSKHANARNVQVRIGGDTTRFFFEVRDDGKGFILDSDSTGRGLNNLRSRAASLEGSIEIDSAPEKGTCVRLNSPIRLRK